MTSTSARPRTLMRTGLNAKHQIGHGALRGKVKTAAIIDNGRRDRVVAHRHLYRWMWVESGPHPALRRSAWPADGAPRARWMYWPHTRDVRTRSRLDFARLFRRRRATGESSAQCIQRHQEPVANARLPSQPRSSARRLRAPTMPVWKCAGSLRCRRARARPYCAPARH
jgi:hypothetical protein